MSAESTQSLDWHSAALADLKAKRDQIDQAIAVIEGLRSGTAPTGAANQETRPASNGIDGPGAFLGMSIVDAAKTLLAAKRQSLRNPDFATAFKAGGLHLNSKDPANTIGSVLTRRFVEVGDIVRVGRGLWGLKEWYPNRSFKKEAKEAGDDKGDESSETTT